MKKRNFLFAVASLSISSAAWALPAQVPQIYYDKLPFRENVWVTNTALCSTPIGAMSRLCLLAEDF